MRLDRNRVLGACIIGILLVVYFFAANNPQQVNGTDNGELTLYKGELAGREEIHLVYGGIEVRTGGGQQAFLNVWYENFRGVGGAGRIYINIGDRIMIGGNLYEVTETTDSYASFRKYP